MALTFLTSSDQTVEVVVTCDSTVEATDEQKTAYLTSGKLEDLGSVGDDATKFTLKALSQKSRRELIHEVNLDGCYGWKHQLTPKNVQDGTTI